MRVGRKNKCEFTSETFIIGKKSGKPTNVLQMRSFGGIDYRVPNLVKISEAVAASGLYTWYGQLEASNFTEEPIYNTYNYV